MAKKTTKPEVSTDGAAKDASPAKPAKRAVAKLAGTVKKKIKSVLEPKTTAKGPDGTSPTKAQPAPAAEPNGPPVGRKPRTQSAAATKKSTAGSTRTSRGGNGHSSAKSFTNDDVALRAYFLAKHRLETGQPGSPEEDWIEAEKQLLAESGQTLVHS